MSGGLLVDLSGRIGQIGQFLGCPDLWIRRARTHLSGAGGVVALFAGGVGLGAGAVVKTVPACSLPADVGRPSIVIFFMNTSL